MAVKVRLTRTGSNKQASYRVVVSDSKSPRDGRFIEIIGHYNPRMKPAEIVIDAEKLRAWISKGAQPTDSVRMLMKTAGLE